MSVLRTSTSYFSYLLPLLSSKCYFSSAYLIAARFVTNRAERDRSHCVQNRDAAKTPTATVDPMRFLWGLIMVLAFVGVAIGLLVGGVVLGLGAVAEAARPVFQVFDAIGFGVQALFLIAAAAFTLWAGITLRSVIGLLLWLVATAYAAYVSWSLVMVFVTSGKSAGATQTMLALLGYVVVFVAMLALSPKDATLVRAKKKA